MIKREHNDNKNLEDNSGYFSKHFLVNIAIKRVERDYRWVKCVK